MKKIFTYLSGIAVVVLVPFVALAQFGQIDTYVSDAVKFINGTLIPLVLAIAFLVFIIGAVRFLILSKDDNSEGRENGKKLMLYGIAGFVLIVSIWGIVFLIANGLGFADKPLNNIPETPIINVGKQNISPSGNPGAM